jgi:hypothetical protein
VQHALGRQRHVLRLQSGRHVPHLVVDLALEHHPVVDHGGDAIEERPLGGQVAGLRERQARQGQRAQNQYH